MAKLTSQDLLKVIKLYSSGMTQQEIADQYGISKSSVSELLKRAGFKARPQGRKSFLDDDDIRQISEMYNSGMSLQEIASQYSVSSATIFNILAKAGVERRQQGRKSILDDDDIRQISEMYNSGMTLQEIAGQYSLSRRTIAGALARAGVKSRSRT